MLDKLKSSERKVPGKKKQLEDMLEELRTKFDIESKRFKAKYINIEHISSSTLNYGVYNTIAKNSPEVYDYPFNHSEIPSDNKVPDESKGYCVEVGEKIKIKNDYNKNEDWFYKNNIWVRYLELRAIDTKDLQDFLQNCKVTTKELKMCFDEQFLSLLKITDVVCGGKQILSDVCKLNCDFKLKSTTFISWHLHFDSLFDSKLGLIAPNLREIQYAFDSNEWLAGFISIFQYRPELRFPVFYQKLYWNIKFKLI